MKQKLILLLSLVSMAWSSAVYAAERVAPTLPTAQTPESGKSYWIYNVGTGLFLGTHASMSYRSILSLDGNSFLITSVSNGYTLCRGGDPTRYLYGYSNDVSTSDRVEGRTTWLINETSGGYTIQRSTINDYYNADEYLGYIENGESYIYPNVTEGNIIWKFLEPVQAAHYAAEVKLYQALEKIKGTALEDLDWFWGQYETLYSNRAIATTLELTKAAQALNSGIAIYNGFEFPEWNDYAIVFSSSEGNAGQNSYDTWALPNNSYTTGSYFDRTIRGEGSSSLTAKISVDKESRFIYQLGTIQENTIYKVYVDGVETRMIVPTHLNGNRRFFEVLSPGTHTITWEFTSYRTDNSYHGARVEAIGCIASPLISVSLLEPGSLGTEVLYNTDHIKNVHNLKIAGKMNDDDWAKIKMMTTLIDLDLSDAEITTVPNNQFQDQYFLRKAILPEGVTSIGESAFSGSNLEETNFPSTLTSTGNYAYANTHIKEVILPENFASLGEMSFRNNYLLSKVDLGETLTTVPYYCFVSCHMLTDLTMPNTLTRIEQWAFSDNYRLVISTLPSSVAFIGRYAFSNCNAIVNMTIPESVRTIEDRAFLSCKGLKTVEVPMANWKFSSYVFSGCNALETLKLNSATVAGYDNDSRPVSNIENVTLQVPSYLVNSYKLDSYWYNAKAIEGFDPNTFDFYEIHKNLTMNGRERFGTNPSAKVYGGIYLKMNGDEAQNFDDFQIDYNSQLWCTGDNIKATGDLSVVYNTSEKRWYFISLPFDMKVANIDAGGAQYAIRYYDGANRATVGATGSWKNYEADDVIPAGTGFIYQTSKDAWTTFYADPDGENKQQIFSTDEFSKPLELHASATAANRGWNLVGNPYQCYYNNHALNFTAPITVWNVQNRTYTAYSLTDDDYAIRPNEAFFVQCPGDEVLNITFPTQGKQLTDVIESQNAGKMRRVQAVEQRQLIDLEVRNGEVADKTRVVMNEEASLGYDMDCDASKFMSAEAPQIYTIGDDGTAYAINERPSGEGEVQLGFYAEKQGAFTISMPRCQAQKVYLVDTFENLTVDLTEQDYGFTAAAGKQEARFRLVIDAGETTAIKDVKSESVEESEDGSIYNLNGQRVGDDYKGIAIKDGKKVYIK